MAWYPEEYIHVDEFQRIMDEKDTEIALLKEVIQNLEVDVNFLIAKLDELKDFVNIGETNER
jgi:hypothetical protein